MLDCRSQTLLANDVVESTYAMPEKTKRGPPTKKNISVRNMNAQITNMTINENAGFKSEYNVRFFFRISLFLFVFVFRNRVFVYSNKCVTYTF